MSRVGTSQFLDLQAAAQIIAPGAIIVDEYQKEITDALRRNSILDSRISYVPATGDFTSYFEQLSIGAGQFVDPRNPTAGATSPNRVPRSAKVKALTNQINYGHYDLQLARQQNNFPELQSKDMNDMINGITLTHGKGLWRGSDTSLSAPATLEYVGLSKQITNTFTVAPTDSIVASITQKVAVIVGSEQYELLPTAVYIHPLALNALEEEERNASHNTTYVSPLSKTMVAGLSVRSIMTAAGELPIIPDPFLTADVNATDNTMTDYGIAILTEPMLEYHYVGEKGVFIFELGTTSDLQMKYVGIKYGAPIAKGASYAHAYGKITRKTVA